MERSRWYVNQRTRPRERDTFLKRPFPQNARLFLVKSTKPLCRYSTIGCHCALFGDKIFATKRNCFPRLGPLKPSATLASIIPNDWIRLHPIHRSYPFFATVRFSSSEFYETTLFSYEIAVFANYRCKWFALCIEIDGPINRTS